MIEPTQTSKPATPVEPPAPPRPDIRREAPAAEAQPQPAAPPPPAPPPSDPVLNVQLDGETMRLYTELRDPETDRVLMRLPAAYHGKEARREDGASIEA